MSGFDTSQPIANREALKNVDTDEKGDEKGTVPFKDDDAAAPGDATPRSS